MDIDNGYFEKGELIFLHQSYERDLNLNKSRSGLDYIQIYDKLVSLKVNYVKFGPLFCNVKLKYYL